MALKECTKKEQANSYELEVNVDGETFGNAVNRVYKKQVKSINIPGFRNAIFILFKLEFFKQF